MNHRPETLENQEIKPKKMFRRFLNPKTVLFLVALFNYVWYFSGSESANRLLRDSIVFCLYCPWYWDWSFTNPPSLLLIAAVCLLYGRWQGYLAAVLTSVYIVLEGIAWMSDQFGSFSGIAERIDIAYQYPNLLWEMRDWQYLFGCVMLAVSIIYLIFEIRHRSQRLS